MHFDLIKGCFLSGGCDEADDYVRLFFTDWSEGPSVETMGQGLLFRVLHLLLWQTNSLYPAKLPDRSRLGMNRGLEGWYITEGGKKEIGTGCLILNGHIGTGQHSRLCKGKRTRPFVTRVTGTGHSD